MYYIRAIYASEKRVKFWGLNSTIKKSKTTEVLAAKLPAHGAFGAKFFISP